MIKKIKIFLLSFILFFSFGFQYTNSFSVNVNVGSSGGGGSIKNGMISNLEEKKVIEDTTIPGIISNSKNTVLSIVLILTVGALIYTGIKLATARGNSDEFKKTWMHLIYIIVGIFIVFASWGIVNLITKINIF